jgi:hypothetical protein
VTHQQLYFGRYFFEAFPFLFLSTYSNFFIKILISFGKVVTYAYCLFNAFLCRIMLLQGGIGLQSYADHFTPRYIFFNYLGHVKVRENINIHSLDLTYTTIFVFQISYQPFAYSFFLFFINLLKVRPMLKIKLLFLHLSPN